MIFKVMLTTRNRKGGQNFVNFECAAETLVQFHQLMQDNHSVFGRKLFVRFSDLKEDTLEITQTRDIILGRDAIHSVELADRYNFVYVN
jgi:hypothetical protein